MAMAMPLRSSEWDQRCRAALDAAAAASAEHGYLGTSTKDIAETLGIPQSSPSYYPPSKQAWLAAMCQIGVTEFADDLRYSRHRSSAAVHHAEAAGTILRHGFS